MIFFCVLWLASMPFADGFTPGLADAVWYQFFHTSCIQKRTVVHRCM
jgi:hypothetical protein